MGMDWTQIIIAVLGALAGIDLGRFLFIKLTKRGMAAEVKEKEIDVIKKLVDEVYKPTIEDLKGEVLDLRGKVDSLQEQVERISRERDECHRALQALTGKVDKMTAGRPARNPRTGRYDKARCDGDDQ